MDWHCIFDLLPSLPIGLENLSCYNNNLTSLPALPATIETLACYNNPLGSLPLLPDSLKYFDCWENNLTSLPALPNKLIRLNCGRNLLSSFPVLPNSITDFRCYNNLLTNLPLLPSNLLMLNCDSNQLSSLPVLPSTVSTLHCEHTALTTILQFPDSLKNLYLGYNSNLAYIPTLPDSLYRCYLYNDSGLFCLPELKRIVNLMFTGTGIQCLPNYGNVSNSTPLLSSLPLCDLFNSNGCRAYWNISGKVYNDTNSNCIPENAEMRMSGLKLLLDSTGTLIQQTYTSGEGFYSFDTNMGTYTYSVDTTALPVYVTCPVNGIQTSVLTAIDSMDYDMDFGMECKPGFDVGVTSVARDSGRFRPANFARINLHAGDMSSLFGLQCASGVSGSVEVILSGNLSYAGASVGSQVPIVSGDTLYYFITDFGLVNFNSSFTFLVQVDTTALPGDVLCFSVNVSPASGDLNISNNTLQHCFTITGSFDPNSKEVFPSDTINQFQQWLTYTIHFQNTGNDTAQHIYIIDTLDTHLDQGSFELLSYSVRPVVQIIGNRVRFNFPNINLVDSNTNEPLSHGYVQYRIKPSQNIPYGTTIKNTAYIVFDFNTPVATNTVSNFMANTTGTYTVALKPSDVKIYPNPFHSTATVDLITEDYFPFHKLEIFDLPGKKLMEKTFTGRKLKIDRSILSNGIYFYRIYDNHGNTITGKLVVQ